MAIDFTTIHNELHQYRDGSVLIDTPFSGNLLALEVTTKPEYATTKQIIGTLYQVYDSASKGYSVYSGKDIIKLELPQTEKLWFSPTQYLSDSYTLNVAYALVGAYPSEPTDVVIPEQILGLPSQVMGFETRFDNIDVSIAGLEASIDSMPTPNWETLTGKPETFAPSTHTHSIGDVVDLSAVLGTSSMSILDLIDRVDILESAAPTTTYPQKIKIDGGGDRGLFWYLGTLGADENFIDPITRGSIFGLMSSILADYTDAKNSVNRTPTNPTHSLDFVDSWIAFDLGANRSILLDRYLLRSRLDFNGNHLRTWVLEGTNSVSENTIAGFNAATWETIDSQNGFTGLTGVGLSVSFRASKDSYYRYIRLRQTGADSAGTNYLTLSGIEFFGDLKLTA